MNIHHSKCRCLHIVILVVPTFGYISYLYYLKYRILKMIEYKHFGFWYECMILSLSMLLAKIFMLSTPGLHIVINCII